MSTPSDPAPKPPVGATVTIIDSGIKGKVVSHAKDVSLGVRLVMVDTPHGTNGVKRRYYTEDQLREEKP